MRFNRDSNGGTDMPKFKIILAKTFHGSSAGTTLDIIEADSESEAITKAIIEWRKVLPKYWGVMPFYAARATAKDLEEASV